MSGLKDYTDDQLKRELYNILDELAKRDSLGGLVRDVDRPNSAKLYVGLSAIYEAAQGDIDFDSESPTGMAHKMLVNITDLVKEGFGDEFPET